MAVEASGHDDSHMDIEAASKRLQAIVGDASMRSKMALLRDVIDDVERALTAGISQRNVLAELNAAGLGMSLGTFNNALQRIRAKRDARSTPPKAVLQSAAVPVTAASAPQTDTPREPRPVSDARQSGSHDPKTLDTIMQSTPHMAELARLGRQLFREQRR
jgi:hypothetical protein